jgi:hypothetical protein
MNEPDSKNPNTPPKESQGQLDQARELFRTMAGEAKHRSELESHAARSRGPGTRLLLWLTIVAAVLAAATLAYGVYMFPDAPIRATDGGYKGKTGNPHTLEEFEAFGVWETAVFIIVPLMFVLGSAFGIADAKLRRRNKITS